MSELINVNGTVTPAREAMVPVLDHGFLYGDGVYETLRTYNGEPSLVERHLTRLNGSCERIRVALLPPSKRLEEAQQTVTLSEEYDNWSYTDLVDG